MYVYDEDDEQMLGGDNIRQQDTIYDGRRQRKQIARRWIDHHLAFARYLQDRPFQFFDQYPQNIPNEFRNLYPPVVYQNVGPNLTSKIIRTATNKRKASISAMAWQPDGKRLVAGYQSGIVTLWNGTAFQYEILMQRHQTAINDLIWSNSGDYMLTVDETFLLKVWQSNYAVIDEWPLHEKKVRQISFSPCDRKFASCSDDARIKIWDFATRREERAIEDYGCDVRTVDWHPSRSIIASGGKDGQVRFFDPRDGTALSVVPIHKNIVTKVQWNQNGYHVLSGSRDWSVRLIDTRMMSEMMRFQGHENDVLTVAWHPTQEELFVSGGFTGEVHWWSVGVERPLYSLPTAHKNGVYQLRYHPLGHILATAGQEGMVRFWVRNKAGDDTTRSSNLSSDIQIVTQQESHSRDIPGLTPYHILHPDAQFTELGPAQESPLLARDDEESEDEDEERSAPPERDSEDD
jgi:polyadenylation factor subunit 2